MSVSKNHPVPQNDLTLLHHMGGTGGGAHRPPQIPRKVPDLTSYCCTELVDMYKVTLSTEHVNS